MVESIDINLRYINMASSSLIENLLSDPNHVAEHRQQMAALDEVNKYLALSDHQHKLQDEMATKTDTADFLRKHAKLNPTSATYENDISQLFAEHPRSTGQSVSDALSAGRSTRQVYLNAVSPGGADEFSVGSPEQHAYVTRFRQTNDPVAARAHALNVQKGEEMIKTSVANGLIDPAKDFPEWDGNEQNRPKVYNQDGSVNYHEMGLMAAQRAGEISGKAAQAEAKSVTDARDLLKTFDNDLTLGESDEAKKLKPILLKRIYDHETRPQPGATGATAPVPAPTSVDQFLIRH